MAQNAQQGTTPTTAASQFKPLGQMTKEELLAYIAAQQAAQNVEGAVVAKFFNGTDKTEKSDRDSGMVGLYGINLRRPVSLYLGQWIRFITLGLIPLIGFLLKNAEAINTYTKARSNRFVAQDDIEALRRFATEHNLLPKEKEAAEQTDGTPAAGGAPAQK